MMNSMDRETHEDITNSLTSIVGTSNVHVNEPMSTHTSFKIGGPIDWLVQPSNVDEIVAVCKTCRDFELPYRVFGAGSNILVDDEGISGVGIKLDSNFSNIEMIDDETVCVQAGASNADVAEFALDHELTGFEFASGIPGNIGGAAYMNAGAYDGQFSDICLSVKCLTPDLDIVNISNEEAHWGYRSSKMMDEDLIVLEATIKLNPNESTAIKAKMNELAHRRQDKQPLELPSAGSTFKRPEGHFAGKLIQDSGMQGHTVGGAQVSTKHAGFVVNIGGASAADVLQVIEDVQAKVEADFGVKLEPEVRIWTRDSCN